MGAGLSQATGKSGRCSRALYSPAHPPAIPHHCFGIRLALLLQQDLAAYLVHLTLKALEVGGGCRLVGLQSSWLHGLRESNGGTYLCQPFLLFEVAYELFVILGGGQLVSELGEPGRTQLLLQRVLALALTLLLLLLLALILTLALGAGRGPLTLGTPPPSSPAAGAAALLLPGLHGHTHMACQGRTIPYGISSPAAS